VRECVGNPAFIAICPLLPRVGFEGVDLVPHWLDMTFDKSLKRGGTSHLTSQFCEDELGPKFQHIYTGLVF